MTLAYLLYLLTTAGAGLIPPALQLVPPPLKAAPPPGQQALLPHSHHLYFYLNKDKNWRMRSTHSPCVARSA
jgi:hypothetical protein